jgi:hypothetical protein
MFPTSAEALDRERGLVSGIVALKRSLLIGILVLAGCSPRDHARASTASRQQNASSLASQHTGADTIIAAYLDLSTESDRYDGDRIERMREQAGPCIEEMYGDGISSYWLARGRLLGYERQVADTLPAKLELLTVAEQVPDTTGPYDSKVIARIQTDTVTMRLAWDSTEQHWRVCGHLSTGFDFGGYGQPPNVHFSPTSMTRAKLLRQVDSIQRHPR